MRRLVILSLVTILLISLGALVLKGSVPTVPTGTWVALNQMAEARTGAGAAVMYDGRILVSGGIAADGSVLASVEIFNTDGSFSFAPPMHVARSGHTATWLADGYVLVTGGTVSSGGVTNSAELYDPLSNTWTLLPSTLADARTGHTATNLGDGNVLLAGGEDSAGVPLASLEVFNLVHETFGFAGAMSSGRKAHAAAAIADGRVILVGGTDADGTTLRTTDIFDQTNGVTAGPVLATPRAGATATVLLDGNVLIAGGRHVKGAKHKVAELDSAELFNTLNSQIEPIAGKMISPRADHKALLLPNNNAVLLIGGKLGSSDLLSTEVFVPWTGKFKDAGAMSSAHMGGVSNALTFLDGLALVAGGSNQANTELTRFATVKTDKTDYTPGQIVTITGSGWKPGEAVTLSLQESPSIDAPAPMLATADAAGNFSNSDFAPDAQDLGLHFTLTAVGSSSGSQAQNTFTDGTLTVTVTGPGTVTGSTTALSPASCTATSGPCTAAVPAGGLETLTASGGTVNSWTLSNQKISTGCTAGSSTCAFNMAGNSGGTVTVAFQTTALTLTGISPTNATYGGAAAVLTATGTNFVNGITIINFNGTDLTTTCSSSTSCTATIPAANLKTSVGTLPVYVHSGTSNSSTQNFTLNKRAITVTAVTNSKIYDGTTLATAAPVITVGTLAIGDTPNFIEAYSTAGAGTGKTLTASGVVSDGNAGNNYAVTFANNSTGQITAKTVTAAITASDKTYDGTTAATITNRSLTGVLAADISNVTLVGGTATFDDAAVGTGKTVTETGLSLTGTASGNYQLAATSATTTASITAKPITITPAPGQSKVYGAVDPALTFTNDSGLPATAFTGALSRAAGENVGNYAISLGTLSAGGNNTVTLAAGTVNFAVVSKPASVAPNSASKVYGDADPTFDGILTGFLLSDGVSATYNRTPGETAGASYSISASLSATGVLSNYDITYNTASFTIGKRSVTITADAKTKMYGVVDPALTYQITTGSLKAGDDFTGAITRQAGETVGSYPIQQGSLALDANYTLTYVPANFTITQADQTIVFAPLSGRIFGDAPFALSATADSNLPVTFSASGPCAVNSGVLTLTGAGDCSVTASQPGDANYHPANDVVRVFTIGKAQATVSISGTGTFTYNGAPHAATATVTGAGGVDLGAATITYTPAGVPINAGTYTVSADFGGDSNHSAATASAEIVIEKAPSVITWANPADITYGTALSGAQLNAIADVPGTLSYNPPAGSVLNAGNAQVLSVSFVPSDATNYKPATDEAAINVGKAALVVTASDASRTYGNANPASFLNSITGFVNGDGAGAIATAPSCTTSAIASSPVASYAITCSGAVAPNYTFTYVPGALSVTKAPLTVTPNNAARSQGQPNPVFTGTIGGIKNSDPITATYSSTALQSSPIGTYPIMVASVTDNGSGTLPNYAVTSTATGTLTVSDTKADLVESGVLVTGTAVSGGSVQVSDTTTNQGGAAGASSTYFYLSFNTTTKQTYLGSRNVVALDGGASSGPVSTTVTIPVGFSGTYYLLACANATASVAESNNANNCSASASFTVAGADLAATGTTMITSPVVSGGSVQVSETTTNLGAGAAGTSSTYFYLSFNTTTRQTYVGSRSVATLAAGASSGPVTTTLTIPVGFSGTYYMLACANATASVSESNNTNNCSASASFTVAGADLAATGTTMITSPVLSGGSVQISETTTNLGAGAAGTSSTYFYLSYNGTTRQTYLGSRSIAALAAGASSGPVTTTLTIPVGFSGTYYMLACANATASVAEANNANNCSASASFTVAGADLVATGTTLITASPVSGGSVQVSETTANLGAGTAGTSSTYFYLSFNGTTRQTYLGSRSIAALAAGASSGPVTTTLTIPVGFSGTYYMLACANATASVAEANNANNCSATTSFSIK